MTGKRLITTRHFHNVTIREENSAAALERSGRRFFNPLQKVHECVFGVLALESEPVDPRL